MAYQSFAATQSFTYSIANGNLTADLSRENCTSNVATDTSKSNTKVQVISCNGSLYKAPTYNPMMGTPLFKASTKNAYINYSLLSAYWRACFYVKGSAPYLDISFRDSSGAGYIRKEVHSLINPNNYTEVCTPYTTSKLMSTGNIYGEISIAQNNTSMINVAYIRLDRMQ